MKRNFSICLFLAMLTILALACQTETYPASTPQVKMPTVDQAAKSPAAPESTPSRITSVPAESAKTQAPATGALEPASDLPIPQMDQFAGLPFHLVGETVEAGGYVVTLEKIQLEPDRIKVSATLLNHTDRSIELSRALTLYTPDGLHISPDNVEGALGPQNSLQKEFSYTLPAPLVQGKIMEYRLLYTPFGWSGPVVAYLLVESLPVVPPPPTPPTQDIPVPSTPGGEVVLQQAYNGITGDPWKMLVLIYPNIDTDYVENGASKHLTATMPAADIAAMRADFVNNQPHRKVVYDYSGNTAELEAYVIIVDRPLTNLEPISDGFWPSPNVTRRELDLYAPKGKYDSVLVFWQASDPSSGQSLPVYGWGLGYWPGDLANGMTYGTVFNLSWYWPGDSCRGEVFLHEWLHGVTGFYKDHLNFPFNVEDLHGAEEAGYQADYDQDNCWDLWLRDYMRGLVYENGQRTALVPATWQSGSITTHDIQNWRGEYYNNTDLSDLPVVVRDDPEINFAWQGEAPHPLISPDHFSARWTRTVDFENFAYRFFVGHDDGARLYIDNQLVFENWCSDCSVTDVFTRTMTAGSHALRLEVWDNAGWASASLRWSFLDDAAPGGRVISPASDAHIEPGPVSFTAEAWDNPGGIGVQRVDFRVYYQGAWHLVDTALTAPYSVTWVAPEDLPDQTMYFAVQVYDRAGNSTIASESSQPVQYAACKTCGPAQSAWPLVRGNLKKDGQSSYTGPESPKLDWTLEGQDIGTAPIIGPNAMLYVGLGNLFEAIRPDGQVAWQYAASKHFNASAAVASNGTILAPNDDGALYAFSPDGNLAWNYATGGWIASAPVLAPNGTIYFGSSDTKLRALYPGGKLKWEFQAGSWISSSPAVGADGTIYFGSTDWNIYALRPDGTLKWRYQTGGYIDSGPVIAPNGTIYIPALDGYLYALDSSSGLLKWKFNSQGDLGWISPAVAADNTIYLPTADPTPEDGYAQASLSALRPDGSILWVYKLPDNPHTSPTLGADGTIYLTLQNGRLYAFRPGGSLKWQVVLEPGGRWLNFNPAIAADGTIYVNAYWPAKVYAVVKTSPTIYLPVISKR